MNPVAWVVVFVAALGTLYRGLAFRRGTQRGLLWLYRSQHQPAMYRNFPLVSPVLGGLLVVILLLSSPYFLGLSVDMDIPKHLAEAIALVIAALLPLTAAAVIALLFRPPLWLVPEWLRQEDERSGFVPHGPGWFDRLALIPGALFFALGLALLGWALLRAIPPSNA